MINSKGKSFLSRNKSNQIKSEKLFELLLQQIHFSTGFVWSGSASLRRDFVYSVSRYRPL